MMLDMCVSRSIVVFCVLVDQFVVALRCVTTVVWMVAIGVCWFVCALRRGVLRFVWCELLLCVCLECVCVRVWCGHVVVCVVCVVCVVQRCVCLWFVSCV